MQNYNEILEKTKDIISQEKGNKKQFNKDVGEALAIRYDIKATKEIDYPLEANMNK